MLRRSSIVELEGSLISCFVESSNNTIKVSKRFDRIQIPFKSSLFCTSFGTKVCAEIFGSLTTGLLITLLPSVLFMIWLITTFLKSLSGFHIIARVNKTLETSAGTSVGQGHLSLSHTRMM